MHAVQKAMSGALQWYLEQGVTDVLMPEARDRLAVPEVPSLPISQERPFFQDSIVQKVPAPLVSPSHTREEAEALASGAQSLEALRVCIAQFEGLALKKTAMNLVFSDGNPQSAVMVIGDIPAAEDDRAGIPFQGAGGVLLDAILASIGLDRKAGEPEKGAYLTNVLNWRPPGGRSPLVGEIEASLPFVRRHIGLVRPKILLLCGEVVTKSLLGGGESFSKVRHAWHVYSGSDFGGFEIPALVTYHPAYLLHTPEKKRAVWGDMLSLRQRLATG